MAEDREQRDWFHKLGNILDKLPKRLQPRVKAALHEAVEGESRVIRAPTPAGPLLTPLSESSRRA